MISKDILQATLNLIKAYLSNMDFSEELTSEQLKEVYSLLQKHDVAHLAGFVFSAEDKELNDLIVNAQYMAVMRYERINYVREKIYELFENSSISFMPLKGSVLNKYYPEAWHRTSCDIDILVSESDLEKAVEALKEKLNFSYKGKSEHDVSVFSPEGVHLELHYDFHENEISTDEVWESGKLAEGKKYQYVMVPEMFITHHIAHIAKHFKYGGCGLRPFVDLWIMKHNMEYDSVELDKLLENKSIKKFSDVMFDLMEVWFGNGETTDVLNGITRYIIDGGVYGSIKNLVTIGQIKKKGKFKYALSRIFLGYNAMKYAYPVLEKHRWLLPFYQVHRWIRLLKAKGVKTIYGELGVSNSDEEQQNKVAEMLTELELL